MSSKKRSECCTSLSAEFKKAVTDYLLVETELAPADLAIVFGSNGRQVLAERAAELYKKRLVKRILVTGGVKGVFKETEARDIQKRLIKMGIPSHHILVENKARNTGENVIYSKKLVQRRLGLKKVNNIIAVGNVVASRRFIMTMKRHWPEAFVMMVPANPYPVQKERWYTLQKFKCNVVKQYRKIPLYFEKDFIREVDIDAINRKAKEMRKKR